MTDSTRAVAIERALPRFWSKVRKSSGCWEWTGGLRGGYGCFSFLGRSHNAHRWIMGVLNGPVEAGLHVDHICKNRACVRPAHLEVVTPRVNTLRGSSPAADNARKTRCPEGHELSGDNLYISPSGWRMCRICRRAEKVRRGRDPRVLKVRAKAKARWRERTGKH